MEAMSQGLPVICLDLGGPGAMLPANCGFKIPARGRTEQQVITDLAEAMRRIGTDPNLQNELAANALDAARQQTWSTLVNHAYEEIERRLAL
jgi:glycosyltransferase involved in cell wall biosynthesis